MANQDINKINKIKLPNEQEYVIDAKYWGGYETSDVKTINGVPIIEDGGGNINITLPSALKYCGITTTPLEDGSTVNPVIINGNEHLASTGCVVFYDDKEFVFNANSKWELFGAEKTYKVVQDTVSSPNVSGDATAFIDTISQDANGVITATKKNVKIPTPDWNANEGEAGYIDNKPFGLRYYWGDTLFNPKNHQSLADLDLSTFEKFYDEQGKYLGIRKQIDSALYLVDIVVGFCIGSGTDMSYNSDYRQCSITTNGYKVKINAGYAYIKETINEDDFTSVLEIRLFDDDTYTMWSLERVVDKIYLISENDGWNYNWLTVQEIEDDFIPDTIARQYSVNELREETTALWENIENIESSTPDWNAQEGEPGYIDNRTHYTKKVNGEIFKVTDDIYNVHYKINQYNNEQFDDVFYLKIFYAFDDNIVVNKLYKSSNFHNELHNGLVLDTVLETPLGHLDIIVYENNGLYTISIAPAGSGYFGKEDIIKEFIVEKIYILDEKYLPDSILKTTPQSLSDADKNQALTNLGIQDKIDKLVNITYLELKNLRNISRLIPGQQYRITDYVTTTVQENTQSVNHQFDIIVTADDVNVLNENARAIQHDGDTYFNGSKLESWELKYCLDNDTNRFAWADVTNGKGVIYYMKDEWNNECPYDFKNIQFKRNIDDSVIYCYTFGKDTDYSIGGSNYGNIIKEYKKNNKIQLNNIVFLGNSCSSNSFGNYCYSNSFGDSCYSNSFGNYCYSNSFGDSFCYNSFGNSCYSNSFGNDCDYNSFGNSCRYNSFGKYCYSNSFGNYCYSNKFGNYCSYNSFGEYCRSNRFGNYYQSNSFGNSCRYNSFGNYCYSNSFGNSFCYNSFGNECSSNSFGDNCSFNSFRASREWKFDDENYMKPIATGQLMDYVRNVHYGDGCGDIILYADPDILGTITNINSMRNINVAQGLVSIDKTSMDYDGETKFDDEYIKPTFVEITATSQDYEIKVARNSAGEIKVFCLADLIA